MDKKRNEKLDRWKERLEKSNSAYDAEYADMNRREELYRGKRDINPLTEGDRARDGQKKRATHVRNIIFENIESEVSSAIPQPKVSARNAEDERLAEKIEHFLRNEIDRMPIEQINDMAERVVPIQGGYFYHVDWDNGIRSHDRTGEIVVTGIHPKQVAAQPGVFTGIEDMDWYILKIPTTKESIRRRYGVIVAEESEEEPDVRSASADASTEEDEVTLYIGYERNDRHGIDRYAWVNDTEVEDLTDYQARHQRKCRSCGRTRPFRGQVILSSAPDLGKEYGIGSEDPERDAAAMIVGRQISDSVNSGEGIPDVVRPSYQPDVDKEKKTEVYRGGPCPFCGADDWTDSENDYEEVYFPIEAENVTIPGMQPGFDGEGIAGMIPTKIPYYKPNAYPTVLQRSVSVYGKLLGNSDVDVIADQQNTINRIEKKIIDRLIKAGTRITLPANANFRTDPEDGERWYVSNAADADMVRVFDFSGDVSQEIAYLNGVYEESRQMLGITDSFQGRRDATATSGKAKEFAASQTAGRLESKRTMKDAAYADLYRLIFQFWLAYGDEPRQISYEDADGNSVFERFSRYDFLKQDADGNYYWDDDFLFSIDSAASLGANREAMWQETRMNFQTGAFGDPSATETLILFWTKMEQLHYPGAAQTKASLQERAQREQQLQMQMQMQMQAQRAMMTGAPGADALVTGPTPEDLQGIDHEAKAQAARAALEQIRGSRNASQPDMVAADRQAKADAARTALARLSPQGNRG